MEEIALAELLKIIGTRIAPDDRTVYETDAPVGGLRIHYARLFRTGTASTVQRRTGGASCSSKGSSRATDRYCGQSIEDQRKTRYPCRKHPGRANLFQSRRPMIQTLRILIISAIMSVCAIIGVAQTAEPSPVTVPSPISAPPPVTLPPQPTAPPPTENAQEQAELVANIKQLQELKAQNDEILKEQQAALDALEELQKQAEQIRIYSKRG